MWYDVHFQVFIWYYPSIFHSCSHVNLFDFLARISWKTCPKILFSTLSFLFQIRNYVMINNQLWLWYNRLWNKFFLAFHYEDLVIDYALDLSKMFVIYLVIIDYGHTIIDYSLNWAFSKLQILAKFSPVKGVIALIWKYISILKNIFSSTLTLL